ncbi:hypothetical protein I862_06265 [endosymbiont of Acanthamoeba sp. UWC8]|uniref:hypothetical protein n=1 Tax=endosymbiont of Acanthamoeba sp. UWC8 TaxID=86106 RepID=UPI0004D0F742|nr:hypothetical protein [endosymbiont of Acanthamoeba sp. UWC8]AIF81807.1 hypothetical protein I862_06265 [endosymbiont of Acanthamoeba sp. UWC8]
MENTKHYLNDLLNKKSPIAKDKMIELIKFKAIIADIEYGEGILENALQTVGHLYDIVKALYKEANDNTIEANNIILLYYKNQELKQYSREIDRVALSTYDNKVLFDGNFQLSVMIGKNVEEKLDITLPCLTINYLFSGGIDIIFTAAEIQPAIEKIKRGMESLILARKDIKNLQHDLEVAKEKLAIEFLDLEYLSYKEISIENILEEAKQENLAKFSPSHNIDIDEFSKFISTYTYNDIYPDKINLAHDENIFNNIEGKEATKHFITKDEAEQLYSNEDIYKYIWKLKDKEFITSEISLLIFTQKILSIQSQMGSSSRDNREVYNIKFQANMDAIRKLAAKLTQGEENDETFEFPNNNAEYLDSGNTGANINILEEDKAREVGDIIDLAYQMVEQNLLFINYLEDKEEYKKSNNECKADMLKEQVPYRFFYKYNEPGEVDRSKLYITDKDVINLSNVYCDIAEMQNLVLYQYATALKTIQNDYGAHSATYKTIFQDLGGVISDIASKLYGDESVKDNLSDYSGFLELMSGNEADNPLFAEFRDQSLYDQMLQISSATENMKKDILVIQAELMEGAESYFELDMELFAA